MGWVHLKIRKATSLEIANQFIIFFQGRFKWTQILFVKIKKIEGPWEKSLWHAVTFFIAKPLSGWHWSHVHLQWVTKSVSGSKKSRLFSRCPYLQKRWAAVDGSTFEIFRQLFLIKYCLLMLIQRGKQCYWVSVNPYLFIYLSIS